MARRFSGPRGRIRGGRGSRNRPRWTALLDTYTLSAGTEDESIIVAPADYRTATSLENEATFLRLHGSLQLFNLSATLYSTVCCAVVKYSENVGPATVTPANQANLQNGDVLWSQVVGLAPISATQEGGSHFRFNNIDIRSKRKLSAAPEGEKIAMVLANIVGGGDVSIAFMGRALLMLKV